MMTMTKAPDRTMPQRTMNMLWFKECPKCEGDLYMDRDMYGPFVCCVQCGYYLTDPQISALLAVGHSSALRQEKEREAVLVA